MLAEFIASIEKRIKGKLFNCQMCGQCELSYTAMRCPMNCPKGLRNGPCGGTLDGQCEVFPEATCTWIDIRQRLENNSQPESPIPQIHAPLNQALMGTSSYVNLLSNRDQATRRPLPFLELISAPQQNHPIGHVRGIGELESALRSKRFTITSECHSPRTEKGLARVHRFAKAVSGFVDAVNTTSSPQGIPSLSSRRTAQVLKEHGIEAIVQVCGRDVQVPQFLTEMEKIAEEGFRNVLCLTGDWSNGRLNQDASGTHHLPSGYFPMESAQMIYEARHIRERGGSIFMPGRTFKHDVLLGGAVNPYSTPLAAVIDRVKQKCAAGVDFFQSQIVTETKRFAQYWNAYRAAGLHQQAFLLASIPILTKPRCLDVMKRLAGVHVDPAFEEAFLRAPDPSRAGIALAIELGLALKNLGVQGVHLMPFGATGEEVVQVIQGLREASSAHEEPSAFHIDVTRAHERITL